MTSPGARASCPLRLAVLITLALCNACVLKSPPPDLGRFVTGDGRASILPYPYTTADVEKIDTIVTGENRAVAIRTATKIALLTFEGIQNQQISGRVGDVTIGSSDCCSTVIALYNAEGVPIGPSWLVGRDGLFIDTLTLPTTGKYTLMVDPQAEETGNLTLALYSLPPNIAGTLTINGSPLAAAISTLGQNFYVEFFGTVGQPVRVAVTDNTLCNVQVSLYKEGEPTLTSFTTTSCPSSFQLPPYLLLETGLYLIFINPSQDRVGHLTLQVTSP